MTQNRSAEEMPYSAVPRKLEPHPDEGDLPPCEWARSTDHPCRRLATHHFVVSYVCDAHLELMLAGRAEDDAEEGLYHARRMLWLAHQRGLEDLEFKLQEAVSSYEGDKARALERAEEARRRAGDPPDKF